MAIVFKITNGDRSLEFDYPNENGVIEVYARVEVEPESIIAVDINKHDATELRDFLNRMIPGLE